MHKLFIPYIMGNKNFIENMKILSDSGADIIEIGVPFSDPVADGPAIMEAGNKAIQQGVNITYIFDELTAHRDAKQSIRTYDVYQYHKSLWRRRFF